MNKWSILSICTIFVGVLLWGLQFYYSSPSLQFWIGILVINSVGVIFGSYAEKTNVKYSNALIAGNILLLLSIPVAFVLIYFVAGP